MQDNSTHRHGASFIGWAIFALVALVVIGFFVSPFIWGYYGMMTAGTTAMNYPFFGWFFWPFGLLIFFFVIFGVVRLLWFPWGRGYYGGGRWSRWGTPEEILKRRYARGEITKDQFDQMMRDLAQHG